MTTWIVTTGSSDVQLKTDERWVQFCYDLVEQVHYHTFDPVLREDEETNEEFWNVPSRVLGLAYTPYLEEYFGDLYFPLLDAFVQKIKDESIKLQQIFVLLSDQSEIFANELNLKSCPAWKDTCTLQTILERYFQEAFRDIDVQFFTLKPQQKGLDQWDSTLNLIQDLFQTQPFNLPKNKPIYISYQAGTPAISSALQFISLSNFGAKIKFLVSNEYQANSTEIVESSRYLRGLKIEQAKGLVSTSPGAAQKMLADIPGLEPSVLPRLEDFVAFFNLNRSLGNNDEFSLEAATQRIVDCLDLIGIFFNQQNYLQGITLLSAAQETFLKVAILQSNATKTIVVEGDTLTGKEALQWKNKGLFLSSKVEQKSHSYQTEVLQQLQFPATPESIKFEFKKKTRTYRCHQTNQNHFMLPWLKALEPRFQSWRCLDWYNKKNKDDLRNQFLHNLRGIELQDVINYLAGYKSENRSDVVLVYNEKVKQPFFQALNLFTLPYQREKLAKQLENLASLLR